MILSYHHINGHPYQKSYRTNTSMKDKFMKKFYTKIEELIYIIKKHEKMKRNTEMIMLTSPSQVSHKSFCLNML